MADRPVLQVALATAALAGIGLALGVGTGISGVAGEVWLTDRIGYDATAHPFLHGAVVAATLTGLAWAAWLSYRVVGRALARGWFWVLAALTFLALGAAMGITALFGGPIGLELGQVVMFGGCGVASLGFGGFWLLSGLRSRRRT